MTIRYGELTTRSELDFVRREVAKFYGTKGNVSEDPVVIMKMKMMLLLYLDSRASWADAADRVRRCGSLGHEHLRRASVRPRL